MRVMDVLKRIKAGEAVMVSLPAKAGSDPTYSLTDGTKVSHAQFSAIEGFLSPKDCGLFDDAPPQSFVWAG